MSLIQSLLIDLVAVSEQFDLRPDHLRDRQLLWMEYVKPLIPLTTYIPKPKPNKD